MGYEDAAERRAFWTAFGVTAVVGLSLLGGFLAGGVLGVVVLCVLAGGAAAWTLRRVSEERPTPLRDAQQAGHLGRRDEGPRALVVAGEALAEPSIWQQLFGRRERPPAVEVFAPVLQSRTHFVTTDIDRESADAHRRLDASLAAARQDGLDATGEVGDPIDPLATLADELRAHDVDEVIVATHEDSEENWVEHDMLERLQEELDLPLKHVVVGSDPS